MALHVLDRLTLIDNLIRIKGTGPPTQLARRLGVSRRCLFDYLELMKNNGAPIKYSTSRNTYYYEVDGTFMASCTFKSAQ